MSRTFVIHKDATISPPNLRQVDSSSHLPSNLVLRIVGVAADKIATFVDALGNSNSNQPANEGTLLYRQNKN